MESHPPVAVRGLHVHAGHHASHTSPATALAAAMILTAFTSSAPPAVAAEPAVFSSSFPHLFYDDQGWMDGQLAIISQFDVLETAFWNAEGEYAAKLDSVRLLNPEIIRLAYVNPAGLGLPAVGDPSHVVNRLRYAIDDAWFARDVRGQLVYFDSQWPDMPLFNLSDQCPRVGGRTWGEFIADFAADEILGSGKWEGIMWDHIWLNAFWLNAAIPDSLDLNLDGMADHPDSVDAWWDRGVIQMLSRFRAQVGGEVIAIGNGNGRHFPYLNGRYFEDFPFREGWTGSLQQVSDWQQFGLGPSLIAPVTRSTETDFQLMRYGLATALVAGTFNSHMALEHSWPNPVIYDEYQVDLGQPTGPPVELGVDRVVDADFEAGIPSGLTSDCGSGEAIWTTDPELVIDGQGSLLGLFGPPGIWSLFVCTDPDQITLAANRTYTISLRYRVVSEPPPDGFFFAGARSEANLDASNRNAFILNPPAGAVGQARGEFTLGPYPDYYVYLGFKYGGTIVIDSFQLSDGSGGVFRRDFERGIALVNPTGEAVSLGIEAGYRRIRGTVDPITNNGATVSLVTLDPEDGLVLVADAAAPETPPPAEMIYAFPNPIIGQEDVGISIIGVPAGGSVAIFSPLGRMVRMLRGRTAGETWSWDLLTSEQRAVPSGVYLAAIRDADQRTVRTLRLAIRR